jgi:hypothetical protein
MALLGIPVAGFWLWAFWPPALLAFALIGGSFLFRSGARVLSTIALIVGLGPIALMVLAFGTPADPYSDVTVENRSSTGIIVSGRLHDLGGGGQSPGTGD